MKRAAVVLAVVALPAIALWRIGCAAWSWLNVSDDGDEALARRIRAQHAAAEALEEQLGPAVVLPPVNGVVHRLRRACRPSPASAYDRTFDGRR